MVFPFWHRRDALPGIVAKLLIARFFALRNGVCPSYWLNSALDLDLYAVARVR
jgi:hypothetical protein